MAAGVHMHHTKLRKFGKSIGLTLPKNILDKLDLTAGDSVDIGINAGQIVVTPVQKPRYKLADLLAQCDFTDPVSEDERLWMRSPPLGKEII